METDQLIRTIAADNAHRARPVGLVLALALLAAAPVSLVMFFAALGVRPDAMTAMHNPFFDLKFLVTLALAISAIAVSLHLSRPEAVLRGWGWDERDRLNVNGSGISLGHPIGATGGRILANLLRELKRRDGRYGLETMCIGGGQGIAAIFERA